MVGVLHYSSSVQLWFVPVWCAVSLCGTLLVTSLPVTMESNSILPEDSSPSRLALT